MKAVIFALVALSSSFASAGGASTGGGGVIYCGATHSIELFDYYEGRMLRGLTPDLGPSVVNHTEKIKFVLQRFAAVDAATAGELWQMVQQFEQEANFVPNAQLIPINDVNGIFLPSGCQYVQAAVQRESLIEGDPYYIVSKDLWDLMNLETRAGLVLHEVILKYLRLRREDTSLERYFHSRIASNTITSVSQPDYLKLKETVGVPWGFLWQEPAGRWWYLDRNAGADDNSCAKINLQTAEGPDFVNGYPAMGAALEYQGLISGPDNGMAVHWTRGDWDTMGVLRTTGVTGPVSSRGSGMISVFCLSPTNPVAIP